jgi:phage/plasmid-associated DNA primase
MGNFEYLFQQGLLVQHDQHNYREISDYSGVRNLLFQLLETHNNDGFADVDYKPTDYNPDGRVFSTIFSTQGLSRVVRGAVCQDTMVDFDMKNAHPTILINLCQKHNIPHDHISTYINHRDEIIQQLVNYGCKDRDSVKRLVLTLINGGYSNSIIGHEWLTALYEELKVVREVLCKHYPDEFNIAVSSKQRKGTTKNIDGSALNFILCKHERQFLDKMIQFCSQNGLEIGSLCHDGCMLLKTDGMDCDQIARDMSSFCGIEIVHKPHDQSLLKHLKNLSMKPFDSPFEKVPDNLIKDVKAIIFDDWSSLNQSNIFTRIKNYTYRYKYVHSEQARNCLWFENKYDGRWYGSTDPINMGILVSNQMYRVLTAVIDDYQKQLDDLSSVLEGLQKQSAEIAELNGKFKNEVARMKSKNIKSSKSLKQLQKELKEARDKYVKVVKESGDEDSLKQRISRLYGNICHVKKCRVGIHSHIGRYSLMKDLRHQYRDDDFINKIDADPMLIGFANGVYDLRADTFRPIGDTDFIQKSTKYNYTPESDPVKREFLLKTFKSMFVPSYAKAQSLRAEFGDGVEIPPLTDEEIQRDIQGEADYEYVMKCVSACLEGRNKFRKLRMFIGAGCNGKSVLVNFFKKVLGEYVCNIDIQALTGKSQGTNPTSALPLAKGCHMLVANESESTDTLQCALIKALTGGDEFTGRLNFKDPITFTPQFTPFIITNNPPRILNMEVAMVDRLDNLSFPFRFFNSRDDPQFIEDEYNKTHFLGRDPDLTMKLDECKDEMFLYLLDIYNQHIRHTTYLQPTASHQRATNEYIEDQNHLASYIQDNYTTTDDPSLYTTSSEIMTGFNNGGYGIKYNHKTFPKAMEKCGHVRHLDHNVSKYKLVNTYKSLEIQQRQSGRDGRDNSETFLGKGGFCD